MCSLITPVTDNQRGNNYSRLAAVIFTAVLCGMLLNGCTSVTTYAPVVTAWSQPNMRSGSYRVKRGDTLYSIAWAYDLDYRTLAATNHLQAPYKIHVGEILNTVAVRQNGSKNSTPLVNTKSQSTQAHPLVMKRSIYAKQQLRVTRTVHHWSWPASGRVVAQFSAALAGNKGIDIGGYYGAPIRAAADGIVVYSGDGVRGYGNLIILKHNNSYLSAYAFNKQILVKRGASVHAGQQIALMGRDNSGSVMLHFEIRRDGKPVNPLRYLS